jgi:hypothetical protein
VILRHLPLLCSILLSQCHLKKSSAFENAFYTCEVCLQITPGFRLRGPLRWITDSLLHTAADARRPTPPLSQSQWRGRRAKPWASPRSAVSLDNRRRLLRPPRRSGSPWWCFSSRRPWRCPAPCCTEPSCRMRFRRCRSPGIEDPGRSGTRPLIRLRSPRRNPSPQTIRCASTPRPLPAFLLVNVANFSYRTVLLTNSGDLGSEITCLRQSRLFSRL